MKSFMTLAIICVALLLIGAGAWLMVKKGRDAVWSYNYRDEGGNIVFVTRKFDLILPGRNWSNSNGTFVAGNGVMMVRSQIFSVSHSSGHVKSALDEKDRLTLSFPDLWLAIIKGETLQVGDREIRLSKDRLQVTVAKSGVIVVTNAPRSELPWDSIEYIRQVSSQLTSNRIESASKSH